VDIHVGCPSCEGAETRCEEYTDIPYVDGKVKRMQDVVYDTTSCHKARIYRTTDNTAQWIPCCGVEPVPEFLAMCQPNSLAWDPNATYIEALKREYSCCAADLPSVTCVPITK
jgi:hypothetical protein